MEEEKQEKKQEKKQENKSQEQEQTAPKQEKQEEENEFTNYYEEERRLLRKALREKKLVVFVGSGASKKSGIPLWDEAVKEYAKGIRFFSENKYEGNLKIPQMYFNARGRKEYVELSRQVFCFDQNLQPNEIHEILISLGIRKFITTNYDNLLEKEAQKQKVIYEVIAKDEDIPYKREEREIIKMHGDFLSDNFVLKEDDYLNYSENFKLMETYIKAVIASNVVLFVGYSFNDPDTKQIFNWIKSILKEDFQRAYMLEVSAQYDPNNEEYYKNLGVNVIYAANLLTKFKKKDENEKDEQKKEDKKEEKEEDKDNLNGKPYECTVKMLDYLLQREEKQKPIEEKTTEELIDDLYCELLPFSKLNVVWYQNINKILRKYEAVVAKNSITLNSENKNIIAMFSSILNKDNKDDKIVSIRKILYSAGIDNIGISNNPIPIKKKEANFIYDWDKFYYFNSVELFRDVQRNELEIDKVDGEYYIKYYMQSAYIYYFLGDFVQAYKQLKQISFKYHRLKEHIWYFIARMNQKYVGMFEKQFYYFDVLNENLNETIYKEVKEIDLNLEYEKLPAIFHKNNDPLKELYTFDIFYKVFNKIINLKINMEKDIKVPLFINSGESLESMNNEIRKYYGYIMFNYIIMDRFKESYNIFHEYIKAVFQFHIAEREVFKGYYGNNFTAITVTDSFEFFIIIQYFNARDIQNIFLDLKITQINLNEDGKLYIRTVCENFFKQYKENNIMTGYIFWKRFENLFALVSTIPLKIDAVEKILEMLRKRLEFFILSRQEKIITNFLYMQYQNKSLLIDSNQLSNLLKDLIEIWEEKITDLSIQQAMKYIFFKCMNILKKTETAVFHELSDIFFKDKKYIGILVSIYKFCENSLKKKIKALIIESLKSENINNLCQYVDCYASAVVILKIFNPDEIIENKILEVLNSNKIYDKNQYNIIIKSLFLLLINGKLIQKDNFLPHLKRLYKSFVEFLVNIENFDYSQFKLEWFYKIKKSNKKLIKEISENETARKSIINLFQEKGREGTLSKELQEIYFKHFC